MRPTGAGMHAAESLLAGPWQGQHCSHGCACEVCTQALLLSMRGDSKSELPTNNVLRYRLGTKVGQGVVFAAAQLQPGARLVCAGQLQACRPHLQRPPLGHAGQSPQCWLLPGSAPLRQPACHLLGWLGWAAWEVAAGESPQVHLLHCESCAAPLRMPPAVQRKLRKL